MKQKQFTRLLSAALVSSLIAGMPLTAFAADRVTYEAENGQEYIVRWTEGIAAPELKAEENDFKNQQVLVEGSTFAVQEAAFRGSQGWFDLTQVPEEDMEDSESRCRNSGYAAAAANLTYWWLQQNNENIGVYLEGRPKAAKGLADPDQLYDLQLAPAGQGSDESPICQLYEKAFPEEAKPDQLLDFFLNGYAGEEDKQNQEDAFKPQKLGGFFYNLLGKKLLTRREEATYETIRKALAGNAGAIVRLQKDQSVRYVNLWGLENTNSGEITALYITDSQDDLGMLRCEVQQGDSLSILGMEITELYAVQLGEEFFMELENQTVPDQPQEKPAEKPQKPEEYETMPQPQWGETSYHWSIDNQVCTAKRVAKDNSDQVQLEETAVIAKETQAPTDTASGVMTYTAEFQADWAETQVKTEKIPQTNVLYNPVTYEWTEDYRLCTAVRTVQGDPGTRETAMAAVKDRESRAPTCTRKGQTTYTAEFDVDWAATQERTLDNIDKLTPNWEETRYEWSSRYDSCTAVRICKNEPDGSHMERTAGFVIMEQTRKPTSTRKGETTYTATFNVDWAEKQQVTIENVPTLSASWGAPSYSWSEDMGRCVAVRKDLNDSENHQTAEAVITVSQTRAPTCLKEGQNTYHAEFQVDWAQPQVQVRDNIEKLTPDWGKTEYDWSSTHRSCTATRTCKSDQGHVETATAQVSSRRTMSPSVTAMGETTYTAVFQEDWAETQQVSVRDVPKLQDLWYDPQYHWSEDLTRCTATRVNQADNELKETAVGSVSSRKTKAPTHDMLGETTYTAVFQEDWAKTQRKVIANIPNIPGNPHGRPEPTQPPQWNDPTYEWNDDFTKCTARRSRKEDPSNVDLTWGTVTKKELKAPTCSTPGEAVYTAEFTEKWAEKQTRKGEIPTLAHDLQKVKAVAATAGKDGLQEHYTCKVCHKLFLDPKGLQEVNKEQLKLSKPSVSDGYAILNGVPEKDNLIAVSSEKFTKALEDNPGSVGVSIAVGSASVTYTQQDIETILKAAGDHKKLQLKISRTDSTDTGLTLEQIQFAERNPQGQLYLIELSFVKNGKNVPVSNLTGAGITVPCSAADDVRVYRVAEDGSFRELPGTYEDTFVRFQGENGLYMLSESRPSADTPQKSHGKIGLVIWSVVLAVSGLLCAGLAGFYFYQKKQEKDDFITSHKFSNPGEGDETEDQEASDFSEEMPEFVPQAFDDAELFAEIDQLTKEDPVPVAGEKLSSARDMAETKASVSPTAPKVPMQEKPSIAEKTAEAVNHKHSKV